MDLRLPKGGQVVNVGIDLVDIERIQKAVQRHGDRFLDRVFTQAEKDYCLQMSNPYPSLAARFAVKEAVSKAFTTGISEAFSWHSVSVKKGSNEEPIACLDDQGEELLKKFGAREVLISMTHTKTYAQAIALLVR